MNKKSIGPRQKNVLLLLKERGAWYDGCGWHWQTDNETIKILESLKARGLVETSERKFNERRVVIVYSITDSGKQAAA